MNRFVSPRLTAATARALAPRPLDLDAPFKINSNFSRDRLNAATRDAYDRLWYPLTHTVYPDPFATLEAAATPIQAWDAIGRVSAPHLFTLTAAFLVTGEAKLMAHFKQLMDAVEAARARFPTPDSGLNDALSHRTMALAAFLFNCNRDEYGDDADYWRDYLLDRVENAWNGMVGWDNLAHAYTSAMATGWFLWRVTENEAFKTQVEGWRTTFLNEATTKIDERGAWVWDHRMPILADGSNALGCQPLVYARSTMENLLILHYAGFDMLTLPELAVTVRLMIRDGVDIAGDVCGEERFNGLWETAGRWAISSLCLYAKFDTTGEIAAYNDQTAALVDGNKQRISLPAAQLFTALPVRSSV